MIRPGETHGTSKDSDLLLLFILNSTFLVGNKLLYEDFLRTSLESSELGSFHSKLSEAPVVVRFQIFPAAL